MSFCFFPQRILASKFSIFKQSSTVKILSLIAAVIAASHAAGQGCSSFPSAETWTWLKGHSNHNATAIYREYPAIYGTIGQPAPDNSPGSRGSGGASWIDDNGNFWLFGGVARDPQNGVSVFLNDLWKFDIGTNQWTWMKGSNAGYQNAIYGTKGVPDPANTPGSRVFCASWKDGDGNLWLFGGYQGSSYNDLWKYNINTGNWTWVSGSNLTNRNGSYGVLNIENASNSPGARYDSVTWIDSSGNLCLYGGRGYGASGSNGYLTDYWKFSINTNNWTWVGGSSSIGTFGGTYGSKGIGAPGNFPGTRKNPEWCTDQSGDLWYFGGYGYDGSGGYGYLNDLWRYDIDSGIWTWMAGSDSVVLHGTYGEMGVPSPDNVPGGRYPDFLAIASDGNLYMSSGSGYASTGVADYLNDLWMYDIQASQWTWIKGSKFSGAVGVYGVKSIPDPLNVPGGGGSGFHASDNTGKVYVYSGGHYHTKYDGGIQSETLDDLWVLNLNKESIVTARTIQGNALTIEIPLKDDQFNTTLSLQTFPQYGVATIDAISSRSVVYDPNDGFIGTDHFSLTLQGSSGCPVTTASIFVHVEPYPCPKFASQEFTSNTRNWVWKGGSDSTIMYGQYGTKGVSAPGNYPGGRENGVTWTDLDGNLWLFGGHGVAEAATGSLNDLWKYNIWENRWTWMAGNNTPNESGAYGTKGVPSTGNSPGARRDAVTWRDMNGNLWLFGGIGIFTSDYYNDLWKYEISSGRWTWVSGSNNTNQFGIYGTLGTPSSSNVPGSRRGSVSWVAQDGSLWLFSGHGYDAVHTSYFLNDVWKFDIATGKWTWMKGSNGASNNAVYGTKGIPAINNKPGGRTDSISWYDEVGNVWVYGGYGRPAGMPATGILSDLWHYNISSNQWTWISGSNAMNERPVYYPLGQPENDSTPGARRYSNSWIDHEGDLWLFGGLNINGQENNDLWEFNSYTHRWVWHKGNLYSSHKGVYGTINVASPGNSPGSRSDSMGWIDNNGSFWLFGGYGFSTITVPIRLNDLWRFSPDTKIFYTTSTVNTSVHVSPSVVDFGGNSSISILQQPGQGSVSLFGGTTNTLVYSPTTNFIGNDRFFVGVSNQTGCPRETEAIATVKVKVVSDLPPVVTSFSRITSSPGNELAVTYTVDFSTDVFGVDNADFDLVTDGVSGWVQSIETINSKSYTVLIQIADQSNDGDVQLRLLDNDTIHDVNYLTLVGTSNENGTVVGPTYTLDRTPPAISAFTAIDGKTFNVAYHESSGLSPTALNPNNYVISGPGHGTLATHPNSVVKISSDYLQDKKVFKTEMRDVASEIYQLNWNDGYATAGYDVILTISNIGDLAGNQMPVSNTENTTAVPAGLSFFTLE